MHFKNKKINNIIIAPMNEKNKLFKKKNNISLKLTEKYISGTASIAMISMQINKVQIFSRILLFVSPINQEKSLHSYQLFLSFFAIPQSG